MPQGSHRSKSTVSTSFLSRRFSAISTSARSNDIETSETIRGPLGLTFLYEPSEALVDFVFVHGLRGGSRKTWSKTDDPAHFWPKEWLPGESSFKNVRISSYGYDSDWSQSKSSNVTIHDFGQALLGDIFTTLGAEKHMPETPMVLIGHSMGGIVIKKVLCLARQDPLYHSVAARIHSMFFLATPHRGADSAQLLSKLFKITVSHGMKAYVDNLVPNSDAIQVINDAFRHAYQGVQLWSFFETVQTSLGMIVERDSAVLDLPGEHVQLLTADHRNVCKFETDLDNNYITLKKAFVVTIDSIGSTLYSTKHIDHQHQMRELSSYLGISYYPENDLANITETQLEGSCQWLTEHEHFLAWRSGLESQPKCFWLAGDPATGKSTMAGHVVNQLRQLNGDCSCFFFKHHSAGKSKIADLLCSLAWQMASMNTEIRQTLLSMQREDTVLDRTDERAIWRSIFVSRIFRVQLRQPHFWVIDGLDECSNHLSFVSFLSKIDHQFPLLVFMTSRPSLPLERILSQEQISTYHEILSRDRSLGDIATYVRAYAQYLPCDGDMSREALVEKILERSNGNFLWTSLVIKELQGAMSEQEISDILDSVPQQLDDLYGRIIRQLMTSPREKRLIPAIFRWVICACRPLTVDELKDALRLELGEVLPQLEKTVSSICGNLVYLDQQMRVWPAHQTVREYLCQEDLPSELKIHRNEAHLQIATVCMKYLDSNEMKAPRHRRAGALSKQQQRSPFNEYAIRHFSDHAARAAPTTDELLMALDKFLKSTLMTWLELVALSKDLTPLSSTAKNLKSFLDRRAKVHAPIGSQIGSQIQDITCWANDLVHLVAQFGRAMTVSPSAIAHLIPPLCPESSMVFRSFSEVYPRGLRLVGLSQQQWDDRFCCVDFSGVQALSIACRDNKYALGLSSGYVIIYHEQSFQEQLRLHHDEPVRQVAFGTLNLYIASAGRKRISLWKTSCGTQIWSSSLAALPMAVDFNEDDTIVMAATRGNELCSWSVATGEQLDMVQFCDINEEDQTEYHYKRPPIRVKFAPALGLLGVAYRQRPVNFWDLADNTFVGQYHKTGAVYPEPLIHDFIFNPNPDVCLAAVAYEADIAVFDPSSQHTIASLETQASSLTASPDGTILASGSGDGIIRIFEFETLRLIHQINSHQQDIRGMAFSSNNLRILDIRGTQYNVWEPSSLAYRPSSYDDSSLNFTESISAGPECVTSGIEEEDLAITAVTCHHDARFIICGRENGSIAMCSTLSGQPLKEIGGHGLNLAILEFAWYEGREILQAVDRCGGYSLQTVIRDEQKIFQSTFLLQKSGHQVQQVILHPKTDKVLVCSSERCEILKFDGSVIAEFNSTICSSPGTWIHSPKQSEKLLRLTEDKVQIHDWESLQANAEPLNISLTPAQESSGSTPQAVTTARGRYLCSYSAGRRPQGTEPTLRLYPADDLTKTTSSINPAGSFDDIAKDIKTLIGVFKSQLLYLNLQGWVCSVNIDDISPENFYTRHFFLPLQWHSNMDSLVITVTNKGCVVLAVGTKIAIFQNGLNFEERVGCKGSLAAGAGKASMRSVLKRGVSEP